MTEHTSNTENGMDEAEFVHECEAEITDFWVLAHRIVDLGEGRLEVGGYPCRVTKGSLKPGSIVYVIREGAIIFEGCLSEVWRNRERRAILEDRDGVVKIDGVELKPGDLIKLALPQTKPRAA